MTDDEHVVVRGDRVRLEQALGNLVDNALRHGAGDVLLAARPGADGVELHVTDAGQGLAPDFIDHAFERFARADGGRARGGAGLGLAIVAAIASSHGGSAHAANLPGGGADVWIDLPGGLQPPCDAPTTGAWKERHGSSPTGSTESACWRWTSTSSQFDVPSSASSASR